MAEHVLHTAGDPVELRLEPDVNVLKSDGLDLAYIKVTLLDREGIIVPDADRYVRFTVEGGATSAGVASSDIFSNELWDGDGRSTYKGRCYLVVRSNRKRSDVTIRASAEGLPAQTLVLRVD